MREREARALARRTFTGQDDDTPEVSTPTSYALQGDVLMMTLDNGGVVYVHKTGDLWRLITVAMRAMKEQPRQRLAINLAACDARDEDILKLAEVRSRR